jgi:hypothetical protein
MKNVKFAEVYQGGVIAYPDAIERFSAILVYEGFVYASYSGNLPLTEAPPPYLGSWDITKLAFRQRFTPAERVAIEAAAAQNNATGFALRASLADQRDATYIGLKRPDTIEAVEGLEAAGLIGEGRAAIILGTPPTPDQLYRGEQFHRG